MYIHAAESFIIETTTEKKAISSELKKYVATLPRPINRFISLALVGALKCLQDQTITNQCAVYFSTEFGNVENTYKSLSDIYINKELPMPFTFVNTLNNMAGFHLEKILNIHSKNLMISSKGISFEKALQLAQLDIASRKHTAVLVGGIDGAFMQYYDEPQIEIPQNIKLKEGSGWLYLNNDPEKALGQIKTLKSFANYTDLEEWLKKYSSVKNGNIAFNFHLAKEKQNKIKELLPALKEYTYLEKLGFFGTAVVAGLVDYLKGHQQTTLLHISQNCYDKYMIIELESF